MINLSLKQLSDTLAAKKISSVELAHFFLDRIAKRNGELNAFITVDVEKTLVQAAAADVRIAKGNAAPLTGIPVAG
jgi:aspartyl-tRNA(Asn)/glutamyl-tRNA(Gln) amidotransferase subunit A